jgi:ABC-type branched-subunit amino acid transport system ATPase component
MREFSEYRMLMFGALMVLMMIWRPQGLLPMQRPHMELRDEPRNSEVSGLSMRFGGLLAVNGVGLTVKEKQVVAMIGPNGAGKTTVFNCITGFYKPSGGTILLDGQPIQGLAGHQIARKGVVRTFQNVRLFKDMTALENLLVAQHRHLNTNFFAACSRPRASAAAKRRPWNARSTGWKRWA